MKSAHHFRSTCRAMLSAKNVSKSFGATRALREANLELQGGTVHILLGENGAGKSTLAKIICGVHIPDSGKIEIDGKAVKFKSVEEAQQAHVGMVFQELSLAPHLSCSDNLFLGFERRQSPFHFVNRQLEREATAAIFKEIGLKIDATQQVAHLPIAQKQLVEITKAVVRQPKILIMDEPSSTLTDHEKIALFEIVRWLKAKGVAILYVTHHLREVSEIGNYVSTMVDGKITATLPVTPDLTEDKLINLLTGRTIKKSDRKCTVRKPMIRLSARRLSTANGCQSLTFDVAAGEIVGIYGVVGCGRESLCRALIGLDPPIQGEMKLDGRALAPRHPAHAKSLGISYLPMDRKQNGILPNRSIRENVNLRRLSALSLGMGIIPPAREGPATRALLKNLLVKYAHDSDPITNLSGGNQQKVLFGRAIADEPKLVLMEDPTAGVDVGAKEDLYLLIRKIAEAGTSFLLFSSDLPETINLCDRVLLMYSGRIVDEIINPSFAHEARILEGVLGRPHQPAN